MSSSKSQRRTDEPFRSGNFLRCNAVPLLRRKVFARGDVGHGERTRRLLPEPHHDELGVCKIAVRRKASSKQGHCRFWHLRDMLTGSDTVRLRGLDRKSRALTTMTPEPT